MRKIFFVRHGKAGPAPEGKGDIDRPLNEKGHNQALDRREELDGIDFDLVISSPALRARETAVRVAAAADGDVIVAQSLYPDPTDNDLGTRLDKLFGLPHLGYVPVSAYLKEKDGDVLTDWAAVARHEVLALIEKHGSPKNVLIAGHAVAIPALAMAIAEDTELPDEIAEINLGECEGFALVLDAEGDPCKLEKFCG